MSDVSVDQLLEELRQICSQYKSEVPSRRRPWPRSIKTRIEQLKGMGISYHRISKETCIPIMTMYSWRKTRNAGSFLPVRVSGESRSPEVIGDRTSTVTVKIPSKPGPKIRRISTVTVTTPDGIKIEGLSTEQVLVVLRGLK